MSSKKHSLAANDNLIQTEFGGNVPKSTPRPIYQLISVPERGIMMSHIAFFVR